MTKRCGKRSLFLRKKKSFCWRNKCWRLFSIYLKFGRFWESVIIKEQDTKGFCLNTIKELLGNTNKLLFFRSGLLMKKHSPITLIIHSWSSYNLIHLNKQLQFMLSLVRDVMLPTCFIHANKFCCTTLTQKWINWILPCTSKQLWVNLFLITFLHIFLQKAPTLYFWTKAWFKGFCNWIVF